MARKAKAQLDHIESEPLKRLISALAFVAFVSKDDELKEFAYVTIKDGMLTATDNTMTMGIAIDSDLDLCLHGEQFRAALQQCGQQFKLTQIDTKSVSIKSQKFSCFVPCMEPDLIKLQVPDKIVAKIDERLRQAFEIGNWLVAGKGTRVCDFALLLGAQTCVATNGHIALEIWHGIDLPPALHIPKRALKAVLTAGKNLSGFGFSANSATFWFDDNSFIKTNLVAGAFPNVAALFEKVAACVFAPLPADFHTGLHAIEPFNVNDSFYIHNGFVSTHADLEQGARYEVAGAKGLFCFSIKGFKAIREYCEHVSFNGDNPCAFYGKNVRGLISGKTL